jgi:hypothetical protein
MEPHKQLEALGLSKGRLRVLDILALIGFSLLIVALGIGSFFAADAYHISSIWVLLAWLSVGFFATVGWDYRREFRSIPFVFFFLAWLILHLLILVLVLGYLAWYWYIAALFLELVAFYASASLLFGLQPPCRRLPTARR